MTVRRFLWDTGSLGASNLAGKLLWALSLSIAMRVLGPNEYGRLVVIWSIAGILVPLTDFGLSALLLRDGARRSEMIAPLAIAATVTRFVLGLIIIILLVTTMALGGFDNGPPTTIALAALGPLVDAGFLTATALAQVKHRVRALAVWRIIGMATLPLLLLCAGQTLDTVGIASSWVIASAIGLAGFLATLYASRSDKEIAKTANWTVDVRQLLRAGLPFLLVGMASISYGKAEVAILGTLTGSEQGGLYHAAYQVILLVFSIGEILFAALNANLFRANANASLLAQKWPTIARILCTVAVVFAPILWMHSTPLMQLIGGREFHNAGPVLRALVPMILALPIAAALNFLVLLDRPLLRASLDAVCVVATAIAAALTTPFAIGAVGVAWIASVIYAGTCFIALWRAHRLGLRMPWVSDFGKAALAGLAAIGLLWIPVHWLLTSAAYALTVLILLFVSRFLALADFGKLMSIAEGNLHDR